ncbi:hypothetical protein MMC24_005080 [Lignoscripta atroalba]|nr:hypothetical protein [Lignoscripta atroalba]
MSTFAYLKEALTGVKWSLVGEVGLDAACVALTLWLRPWGKVKPVVEEPVVYPHTVETPAAPRAKRFHNVCVKSPERPHKLFGLLPKTLGSCWSSPASLVPAAPVALPPSPLVVKKKKSVVFAEWKNQTRLVDSWIDRRVHVHRPGAGTVRFACEVVYTGLSRWIEPDGHNQLHFPRTKWIRDVPDPVEDLDGDVEMLDADVETLDGDIEMIDV